MDKKLAGLLGAVAGLATMGTANAAIHQNPPASPLPAAASYSELLTPVGNASQLLVADDAARTQEGQAHIQLAQDHHHHHRAAIVIKRRHHHHHRKIIIKKSHHHHHHSMYMPGVVKKA